MRSTRRSGCWIWSLSNCYPALERRLVTSSFGSSGRLTKRNTWSSELNDIFCFHFQISQFKNYIVLANSKYNDRQWNKLPGQFNEAAVPQVQCGDCGFRAFLETSGGVLRFAEKNWKRDSNSPYPKSNGL